MQNSGQPTLSDDEFTRLQEQLINLRTENYELSSQLHKTQTELNALQEKCTSQDKELARVSKLMKFPGFQAITKNKRKGNYDEVVEENERLSRQMQRHEEDFNLQNKTLLEEVARISNERDQLEVLLTQLRQEKALSVDSNDEFRRLKAENEALQKAVRERTPHGPSDISSQGTEMTPEHQTSEECASDHPADSVKATLLELRRKLEGHLRQVVCSDVEEINKTDEEKATLNMQTIKRVMDSYFDTCITHLQSLEGSPSEASSADTAELKMKLETEVAEKRLLLDQLTEERESFQKETTSLKEERDKLKEKHKKKQESFLQIQEEKDSLDNEKRNLEANLVKVTEVLNKQQEELEESRKMIEILRNESANLQQDLQQSNERCESGLSKGLSEKSEEIADLQTQLQEYSRVTKNLEEELLMATDERDQAQKHAVEQSEIAERRKALLDDMAIQKQADIEQHSQEMKKLNSELQVHMDALEQEKTRTEELNIELSRLGALVASSEQRSIADQQKIGWLERTLEETEGQLLKEKEEAKEQLANERKEHEDAISILKDDHSKTLEDERSEKEKLTADADEQKLLVSKLTQAAKDREVEFRISNKKTDNLVKDLKRQFNMEKKRADQMQQRLQDFLSEARVKQTFEELFTGDSSHLKGHRRQDSGSHLSNISSVSNTEEDADANKASNSSAESVITGETLDLVNRVADLQQQKWILEEKVRHLEENGAVMADDLMMKTAIIQSYAMDTKTDHTPEHIRKKNPSLKDKMLDTLKSNKSEETLREMTSKLQRMLEETLVKNVQLQQHVDYLSQEVQKTKDKQQSES